MRATQNMEKIYTIGFDKSLAEVFGTKFTLVPELLEAELNDWTIALFKEDISALIITLPSNSEQIVQLIKIALHIRLSLDDLKEKSLIPIVFTSTQTLYQILIKSKIYGHIFSTVGSYFINPDKVKTEISEVKPILVHEYKTGFLDVVTIRPDETLGKHSLANIWGAYTLDKVAKTRVFENNDTLKKQRAQLYLKFVSAFNFDFSTLNPGGIKIIGNIVLGDPIKIASKDMKILLIDDEADKGWEPVLRKIFKTSQAEDFKVINQKVKDYDAFSQDNKDLIEGGNFDLFLIDLRLNGLDEEDEANTRNFSGIKVFKKIKELNNGNQAIIFTASNKTWNLKYLLDEGANGYYLKEGPEFNFTNAFSEKNYENFRDEVTECFYYKFLKDIHLIQNKCIEVINSDTTNRSHSYQAFYDRAKSGLETGFTLLEKSYKKEKYLSFAFLTFFQILEDYSNQKENYCKDDQTGSWFVDSDKLAIDSTDNEWCLKFITGSGLNNFGYFEIEKNIDASSATTLAKISFILYLKFSKNNSYLLNWGKLNHLRNTKAGHGTNKGDIQISEVFEILELVQLFLTSK